MKFAWDEYAHINREMLIAVSDKLLLLLLSSLSYIYIYMCIYWFKITIQLIGHNKTIDNNKTYIM